MLSALRSFFINWFRSLGLPDNSASPPPHEEETMVLYNAPPDEHEGVHVPYDENLLERARTQWQFGDWETLASLERNQFQHHPEREKIALLAAAGLLQVGETGKARNLIKLAQDWGVSNKIIGRVLIAGVHNSIARASVINRQEQRASRHFEMSVKIGTPGGDFRLLSEARAFHESNKIGFTIKDENLIDRKLSYKEESNKELSPSNSNKYEFFIRKKELANHRNEKKPTKNKPGKANQNKLINGISLTSASKDRWPYFINIEEIQINIFLTLIKEIKPKKFFDIGANVGFYTLIAQKFFPELECIAFEPSPETFLNLKENIAMNRNKGNIEALELALSSRSGTTIFGDFGDCSGKNAILETSIHTENDLKNKISVNTNTLDSFNISAQETYIVKIDTEGHELEILKGGKRFFETNSIVLQIETGHKENSEKLIGLINRYGLSLMFNLGPDTYFTNIQKILTSSTLMKVLEDSNKSIISNRWD